LAGYALDGYGIYGYYESTDTMPDDLDACGGHTGSVPAYSDDDTTYSAASDVYHYHISTEAPYTLGCFGPVSSVSACKALYSTCDTGYSCFTTADGTINYDTDCPCYRYKNKLKFLRMLRLI
jgi:hypothetical protein